MANLGLLIAIIGLVFMIMGSSTLARLLAPLIDQCVVPLLPKLPGVAADTTQWLPSLHQVIKLNGSLVIVLVMSLSTKRLIQASTWKRLCLLAVLNGLALFLGLWLVPLFPLVMPYLYVALFLGTLVAIFWPEKETEMVSEK